jgi:hypothetical protein
LSRAAAALLGLAAFVLLATANGAGYRFGVSDQAAYVPAVVLAEHPDAFPRDATVIRTQGQFFVLDEALAAVGESTGASVEALFLGAYLLAVAVIWLGAVLIGSRLYRSAWLTCAFVAVVTLRHRITLTSANSVEPYFHPRLLAFGLGLIAVAAFLRRRDRAAVALVAAAAVCHVTTAIWFAILIGVALTIVDRRWRLLALAGSVVAAAVLLWVVIAGPLHGGLMRMDAVWIEAVAGKDYLFANEWPVFAWFANLGLLALLWIVQSLRKSRGTATPQDAALAWGATVLVAVFLLTLPAVIAHVALAVQFQISRVFWILDVLAAMYLVAAVGETLSAGGMRVLAGVLVAFSFSRGAYVLAQTGRPLFETSLPDTPWRDAMQWIARQPLDVHVLADPNHAFKYGSSVRVAAGRDVLLEDGKDSAIAIYSHALAERVVSRRHEIGDFTAMTADRARALAATYGLHYLVTEATLPLPEAYRNSQFRIYVLRPAGPSS